MHYFFPPGSRSGSAFLIRIRIQIGNIDMTSNFIPCFQNMAKAKGERYSFPPNAFLTLQGIIKNHDGGRIFEVIVNRARGKTSRSWRCGRVGSLQPGKFCVSPILLCRLPRTRRCFKYTVDWSSVMCCGCVAYYLCVEMDICLTSKHFYHYPFCVCANGFQGLSKAFQLRHLLCRPMDR